MGFLHDVWWSATTVRWLDKVSLKLWEEGSWERLQGWSLTLCLCGSLRNWWKRCHLLQQQHSSSPWSCLWHPCPGDLIAGQCFCYEACRVGKAGQLYTSRPMHGKEMHFSPHKKQCRYYNIVMLITSLSWDVYCYFLWHSDKAEGWEWRIAAHCSCHSFSLILVGIDATLNRNNLFSMAVNYLHVMWHCQTTVTGLGPYVLCYC